MDCGSQGGSQGGSDDSFDEHLSQIQIEEERQDMTDVSMSPDYFIVNKSILKLNICVRLSVSVLLHYNCKVNANIQGVYHRPKLERSTRRYIGTALRGALYSLCYLLFVVCM